MESRRHQELEYAGTAVDKPRSRPRLVLVWRGEQAQAPAAPAVDPGSSAAADQLLQVELPARPGMLATLGMEMQKEEPDFARVSTLINADLGLASAVVKTANSPYFGLGRRVGSVQEALYYLGLGEVFSLITGFMLRRVFASPDPLIERIWTTSARRAEIMRSLARARRWVAVDRAHTCGLFEDCGMAVLLLHAPGYRDVLPAIESAASPQDLEREQYGLDHGVIGDALVRTWGLPETIARAVRHHHQVVQLPELDVPMETRTLIALSGVAREVVARAAGHKRELWPGEMPAIAEVLGDDVDTLEARVEELVREPDSDA